jgi:hypothetical protein
MPIQAASIGNIPMQQIRTKTTAPGKARPPLDDKVARLIAGDEPPPWLLPFLQWLTVSFWYDRRLAYIQSTPSIMRERLEGLREAASLIRQRLNGPVDRQFLEYNSGRPIPPDLARNLQHFASVVGDGDASLSRPDGTTIRGRRRVLEGPSISSKTLFAARFFELWTYFYGREPGPQELYAAEAAKAYWEASGGQPGASANPVSSWRHHFEMVRFLQSKPYVRRVRALTRIDIIQAARRGRPSWSL